MRGDGANNRGACTIRINCLIICWVMLKSAITPSFIGRIASMLPGTLPSICFASLPTARMVFFAIRAAFLTNRHDRRLVEDDALATHVDQCVRGAEIDRQIVGKVAAQKTEHSKSCLTGSRCDHTAVERRKNSSFGSGDATSHAGCPLLAPGVRRRCYRLVMTQDLVCEGAPFAADGHVTIMGGMAGRSNGSRGQTSEY